MTQRVELLYNKPFEDQSITEKLLNRAYVRRNITDRKSVQNNAPDRIADLLEEAAAYITQLEAELTKLNAQPN